MKTITELEKGCGKELELLESSGTTTPFAIHESSRKTLNCSKNHLCLTCQTKLQTLKQVCEEIDKVYKNLDMGKTIPIFIQRLKEKFHGEEQ